MGEKIQTQTEAQPQTAQQNCTGLENNVGKREKNDIQQSKMKFEQRLK